MTKLAETNTCTIGALSVVLFFEYAFIFVFLLNIHFSESAMRCIACAVPFKQRISTMGLELGLGLSTLFYKSVKKRVASLNRVEALGTFYKP